MRLVLKAGLAGVGVIALVAAGLLTPGASEWMSVATASGGDGMSHGPDALPGVLDAGDSVNLQKKPDPATIHGMVDARASGGPQIAGDWGDVLVYRPNGDVTMEANRLRVVQHRALLWVDFNPATGLFDAPAVGATGVSHLVIPAVGAWDAATRSYVHRDLDVVLALPQGDGSWTYPAGQRSGWITKGDREADLDQTLVEGIPAVSGLVAPEWIEARVTRVIDTDQAVREIIAGVGVAVLAGVAFLMVRGKLRWPARARVWGRKPPRSEAAASTTLRRSGQAVGSEGARPHPGKTIVPVSLRRRLGLAAHACDCGAAWRRDLAFCLMCGAERAPRTRYATPEAHAAARAEAQARRGKG